VCKFCDGTCFRSKPGPAPAFIESLLRYISVSVKSTVWVPDNILISFSGLPSGLDHGGQPGHQDVGQGTQGCGPPQ
jgi:hypothetical protein